MLSTPYPNGLLRSHRQIQYAAEQRAMGLICSYQRRIGSLDDGQSVQSPDVGLAPRARTQAEHVRMVRRDTSEEQSSSVELLPSCSGSSSRNSPVPPLLHLAASAAADANDNTDSFSSLPLDLAQLVFDELARRGALTRLTLPKFVDCHLAHVRWYFITLPTHSPISFCLSRLLPPCTADRPRASPRC